MQDCDMGWAIERFEVLVAKYGQGEFQLGARKIEAFWQSVFRYDREVYETAVDALMYSWTRTVHGVQNGIPVPPTVEDVVVKIKSLIAQREKNADEAAKARALDAEHARQAKDMRDAGVPPGMVLHVAPEGEALPPRLEAVNKRTVELTGQGVGAIKAFTMASMEDLDGKLFPWMAESI